MRELIHTEEREGFLISLYRHAEDISPRGQFMTEDGGDDEELLLKIEDGTYDWFCAEVSASKEGIELHSDFLGGCCYDSAAAFVTSDGYYPDMVAEAISGAKAAIAKLCAEA